MSIIKFETGKTYTHGFATNSESKVNIKIERRTDKCVWIKDPHTGEIQRRGIDVYNGVEQIFPYGRYSMASILGADKPQKVSVNFETSDEEKDLINQIVDRFQECQVRNFNVQNFDVLHHAMNLTACHLNGTPIDFNKLLKAPVFSLMHDMHGIDRNINRTTGKLENCFLPRTAA